MGNTKLQMKFVCGSHIFFCYSHYFFFCINYSSLVFHVCVVIFKAKINVGKWNIDDEFIAATKTKNNETKLYGLPNRKTTLKVLGAHQNSFEIISRQHKL